MQPSLRLLSAVLVAILMVLGAVFTAATADKVKVWKWTDAKGTVVYSQRPPPGNVKAEEKYIDPNRSVIESGWLPPAPATSASGAVPSSEERAARDSRSRRIARQGGGASTEEPAVPGRPAVPPPVAPPAPPPALAVPSPPPAAPPAPPPALAVPSPGPGGF
jgi:hypothetical protein